MNMVSIEYKKKTIESFRFVSTYQIVVCIYKAFQLFYKGFKKEID